MTNIFAHETVMRFFKTGEYRYKMPGTMSLVGGLRNAPQSLDFFGLNFYSEVVIGLAGPTHYPHQAMTDMEYPVWPEKMYDALQQVNKVGKPIYITENGIPDAKDDRRPAFIKSYLTAVHKALSEGMDIRGYFHWTLMDNFEWNEGYTKKFGLYEVDFNNVLKPRTPRPSSLTYRDFMRLSLDSKEGV